MIREKIFGISYDDYFMKMAVKEALVAFDNDEIPVGAIVVVNNQIIGSGHNQTQILHDITAHAEIIAISSATEKMGAKYLEYCTLYTTLEPCVMCAGAIFWSKIERLVFGAFDKKFGYSRHGNLLHPKTKVTTGVLTDECSSLMTDFFKRKRD
jgi:tRNA(adenine34) deaminase